MGAKKKPTVCGPLSILFFYGAYCGGRKIRKDSREKSANPHSSKYFLRVHFFHTDIKRAIFSLPGRLIVPVIAQLGFNILHDWTLQSCTLWHSLQRNDTTVKQE